MRIRWLYWLGNAFYPERCPYCNRNIEPEEIACDDCIKDVLAKHKAIKSGVGGFRCISSFVYGGKIRRILLRIKYHEKTQFIAQLAELLAMDILMIYRNYNFDIITAVPMHWIDELDREYNQSVILAKKLGELTGIPYLKTMEKIKRTEKQHNLNYAKRKTNLIGAFQVIDPEQIKGKRILVIDDILTSGNTLAVCCKTLNRAKPELICCATLATAKGKYPPQAII